MDNYSDSCQNQTSKKDLFNALSVELNNIQAIIESTLQKSADLYDQIAICEDRQKYVDDSLAESKKIAEEITGNAEQRVRSIIIRAENLVGPQREQIACLEQEIAELDLQMNPERMEEAESPPPKADPLPQPAVRREFSLREPQELDPPEDITEMMEMEQNGPTPQLAVRREYSLREPQEFDPYEGMAEQMQLEQADSSAQLMVKREFSLREPQELDISGPVPDMTEAKSAETACTPVEEREYSLREPLAMDEDLEEQQQEAIDPDYNESLIHVDAIVDARHFETIDNECNEQVHNHCWKVQVEVGVPAYNHEFVGYGKVFSAVTSTLLRFDDVVLNEVFPFNIIEPSPENIAMYFYNCLEDTLAVIDIHLNEINLCENQVLIKKVQTRNTEFDDLLRGEDILQDIRETLSAREQENADSSFKNMLGQIFKNRN